MTVNRQVFGGEDDTYPQLTRICHTQSTPQQITSTGRYLYVRFKAGALRTGKGFSASYAAVPGGERSSHGHTHWAHALVTRMVTRILARSHAFRTVTRIGHTHGHTHSRTVTRVPPSSKYPFRIFMTSHRQKLCSVQKFCADRMVSFGFMTWSLWKNYG